MVEPDQKTGRVIVMKIEEPGVSFGVIEKSPIPCIAVVIVIVGFWVKLNGKVPFFKWILPLLNTQNIFDNTF